MGIVGRAVPRATRGRNGGSAYTRRHARTRHRRRRIHRLEPRRRSSSDEATRSTSWTICPPERRATSRGALAAGATLHTADIRDGDAMRELFASVQAGGRLPPRGADRRPRLGAPIRPTTRARTSRGRSTCSRRRRVNGVRRFVFASTGGAIYGETDVMPTPEDTEARPMAPYGTSKLCAEQYLGLYERLHGMSTVALRFGNVYGPRQDVHGEAGVIAIFCGRLRRGEDLRVFGDGEQTRDYIYVGDLVEAIATAGEGDATGAINLGTEEETSVLRVAELLQVACGGDLADRLPARATGRDPALGPRRRPGPRGPRLERRHAGSTRASGSPGRRRPTPSDMSGSGSTPPRSSSTGRASTGTPAPCAGRCASARTSSCTSCGPAGGSRGPCRRGSRCRPPCRGPGTRSRSRGRRGVPASTCCTTRATPCRRSRGCACRSSSRCTTCWS